MANNWHQKYRYPGVMAFRPKPRSLCDNDFVGTSAGRSRTLGGGSSIVDTRIIIIPTNAPLVVTQKVTRSFPKGWQLFCFDFVGDGFVYSCDTASVQN